jgi:hypothetical protein
MQEAKGSRRTRHHPIWCLELPPTPARGLHKTQECTSYTCPHRLKLARHVHLPVFQTGVNETWELWAILRLSIGCHCTEFLPTQ